MNNVKPYFVEDIARKLKAAYFSHHDIGAARVVFHLCTDFGIEPTFMKPEHIQALKNEFEKG